MRLYRIFIGLILGLAVSLLIYSFFNEHYFFYTELPIYPFLGAIIGMALGWLNRIPSIKLWKAVLIFALIIISTIGYAKMRDEYLRTNRIRKTESIALLYPSTKVLDVEYEKGNGMDKDPNVVLTLEADGTYEDMISYIYKKLEVEDPEIQWNTNNSWKSHKMEGFFRSADNSNGKMIFSFSMYYRPIFNDLHHMSLYPVFIILDFFI